MATAILSGKIIQVCKSCHTPIRFKAFTVGSITGPTVIQDAETLKTIVFPPEAIFCSRSCFDLHIQRELDA